MKNIWKISVASVAILSLLAGCGETKDSGASTSPSAASKNNAQQQPVTLKFFNWSNGNPQVKASIEKFQEQNPNIKIEDIGVAVPALDALKKLDVMLASGEQIDVVMTPNVDELASRAANGVLAPLDDLYAKNNLKPQDEYFINPQFKGQTYGMMADMSFWFTIFNQDALKEANLTVPTFGWTYDDYREYAKKLTKGEGNNKRYGTYFHTWTEFENMIAYEEMKHPQLKPDYTLAFDDPSYQYFFNLRRAMEKEDKSVKPYSDIIGGKLSYTDEFMNQQAAFEMIGSWMLGNIADTTKYPHTFKTAFAPLPRSSKDAEIGNTNIGGDFYSITKTSKNQDAAFKFIRYMSTEGVPSGLPGWRKADGKAEIEKLIGDKKDLFDIDSLVSTIYDKRVKTGADTSISAAYVTQLKKVVDNNFASFMLDNKSFEETLKRMNEEGKKILDQNK